MLEKIGFIRDEQNDSHEKCVFTDETIIQQALFIIKKNLKPLDE